MKPWRRALGNIRLLGPDIPPFRRDVKLVNDYIEALEKRLAEQPTPVVIDANWPGYDC